MQTFATLNIFLIAISLCSISEIAFSCGSLRFMDNTPTVTLPPSQPNYTLTFRFSHGNSAGKYECFVRVLEKCPPTRWEHSCDQMQDVTFTNLHPGAWFSCGVRCTFGGIQRMITRSFPTPAAPQDCCPYLVNDGVTFTDYSADGNNATTCLEWASTGSPEGFQCRVDAEAFHDCESPYCRRLTTDQHTFQVIPTGCAGAAKTLVRRVEVPAQEVCVRPFSIN